MRFAASVGLAAVFASPLVAGEPPSYRAVVTDEEVILRAGPSDAFDETGTLKRGAAVVVEREEGNGWLAVAAPSGAVSWIAHAFVEDITPDKPTPRKGVVHSAGEITVAAGRVGEFQPLNTRREKVPQGTIVTIIGPPVDFAGKKWWPIAPPPGDVRYLPRTAVQFDKPVNNNFTLRVTDTGDGGNIPPPAGGAIPAGGPLATVPGPGTTTPAGGVTAAKPPVNHPLWAQAEAAERDNRLADAEKAYFDLAALMNAQGGDHDVANLCYTRIHAIREKKRTAAARTVPTSLPPQPQSQPKDDRGVRPGTPQPLPPADTKANSGASGGSAAPGDGRGQWSGAGTLRRSGLTLDGSRRNTYMLESAPGEVKMFVLPGLGVELEKFVGKRVEVFGVPQSQFGTRKPTVEATAVEEAK